METEVTPIFVVNNGNYERFTGGVATPTQAGLMSAADNAALRTVHGALVPRASGLELNDVFGDQLIHQWRCDTEHCVINGGLLQSIDDRVTKRVSSRLTGTSYPTAQLASPVFGGRNAANFGTAERHSKRLYTTDASCSAQNPFTLFGVFAFNSTPVQNNLIWGNGDASSAAYFGFAASGLSAWPNALISTPIDLTSRLAHAAIICYQDASSVRSRGVVIRSDGMVYRPQDFTGSGATTGAVSGVPCIGNTSYSGNYGAPVSVADHGQLSAHTLTQRDVAAFFEYLRSQYGFLMPAIEVLVDGNSINNACHQRFRESTLPHTNARFFSAVPSRDLPMVLGALRETANTRSCLTPGTTKVYAGNEVLNSIIAGATTLEIQAYLTALWAKVRACGYSRILYGTCMAASALSGATETRRNEINAWMVVQRAAGAIDGLVNLHSADAIDGYACPSELLNASNPTYFADDRHPTSAGYDIYWPLWTRKLVDLGC